MKTRNLVSFKRLMKLFGSFTAHSIDIRNIENFMPAFIISILIVLVSARNVAAQENFWNTLAEVGFEKGKDANGYEIEKPLFSKHLKSYNGKKIRLKGYIIPLNEVNNAATSMFSALPFNVCYFCGAAGPETVVELQTAQHVKFTSKPMIIEGILELNEKDPDHHIYIVKSATVIKE